MSSNGPTLEKKKRKFGVPHIFILLFGIIVFCSILTWIIPAGQFDRVENDAGRMIAVAGTWHAVSSTPVGFFATFKAVYDGMLNAADISMLIFITFASTSFITKSGAFDGLVVQLMKVFKGNSSVIVIPIFMALFGIGSSTVGMFEEWLPFIPIFAGIFIGLGYDAIVGLATVALGAGIGYSGACMNPFTVGVAQGIAEVPYMSDMGFRIFCHVCMIIVGAAMVMHYALKVKKDPTKSIVYGVDFAALGITNDEKDVSKTEFGVRQILILLDLLAAIIVLVWGVKTNGWYFAEISTVFLIMGVVAAIIMHMNINEVGETFAKGFAEAAMPALLVGISRGILIVLQNGNIIDTVVNGLAAPLANLPLWLSGIAMLLFQTVLNFFIPSGSGQAATSMPIMTPLADIIGMKREVAVLAFQFGDGLSNIVWPTAYAAVMAGLAGVKIDKWWKFIFPVFGALLCVQAVHIVIATMWSGFGAV